MDAEGRPIDFSLVRGGPLRRLLRAARLVRDDRLDLVRPIAAAIGVAWLPLVVLSAIRRPADGPELLRSVGVHARLLVAVPCFLIAESSLHMRTRRCIARFMDEGWAPGQDAAIERAAAAIGRLRDAALPEVVLLACAIGLSNAVFWGAADPIGARGLDLAPGQTPAILWYGLVSLPLLQFLALRWLWRWALWTILLARLASLPFRPIATHPDGRGGFAFLAEPSVGFSWVVFAGGAVLAGAGADRILLEGARFESFIPHAAVYLAASLLLAFGPVLPFAHGLWRAYFDGIRAYGALAADYTRRFQRRWIDGVGAGELLGTSDIQSLADLAGAYEVLRRMVILPITRRALAAVAIAAIAPFALLVLTEVRLLELLREVGGAWLARSAR